MPEIVSKTFLNIKIGPKGIAVWSANSKLAAISARLP